MSRYLDITEIRKTTRLMFSASGGRPGVSVTDQEFEAMVALTLELRTRHNALIHGMNTRAITAGEFWDSDIDLSEDIFTRAKALLGSERYELVFDTTETRIEWCTRKEFIQMHAVEEPEYEQS